MKITDVTYNIDIIVENISKYVLSSYNSLVLNEQKIDKKTFEKVLLQINTIIQQKIKTEAAKKKKAPSIAMLSSVLKELNFQPDAIESILVKSGIDPTIAKKISTPIDITSKKSRNAATAPKIANDPTSNLKKMVNDLVSAPYQTPAMQNIMKGFQKQMIEKIDAGMSKEELTKKILWQIQLLKKQNIKETASGGSTSAGSVASVANPGGPMMPMIKRMPAGQSFFAPYSIPKSKNQRKKLRSAKKIIRGK